MKAIIIQLICVVVLFVNNILTMETKLKGSAENPADQYYVDHKLEWATEQGDGVTCLAYSPSIGHHFFVSGSEDHTVCLWKEDGTNHTWATGDQPVSALAISPDGKELAVGTFIHGPRQATSVLFYDVETGRMKNKIRLKVENCHKGIADLSYDPDGSLGVAVLHDGSSWIWGHELINPVDVVSIEDEAITCARIIAQNLMRFVTCKGEIYEMKIGENRFLPKLDLSETFSRSHVIGRTFLSADGNECLISFIESKANQETQAKVWRVDIAEKTCVYAVGADGVAAASFAHDRSVCASIFRRMLTIIHKMPESEVQQGYNGAIVEQWKPDNTVTALTCSMDGQHLATTMSPHTIALWRIALNKKPDMKRDESQVAQNQ